MGSLDSPNHHKTEPIFPTFDDLPPVSGQPQGCLWGFFDTPDKKDELGTLNILTPSVVLEAGKEIQFGHHVQLDWPMNNLQFPASGRAALHHHVKEMQSEGFVGLDDEIYINTQTSSQWDSLKHWAIQDQGVFYNRLSLGDAVKHPQNGIHNICERGGIVGRGILVDWLRWWQHHNPTATPPSPISSHAIPLAEIKETLKWQGTECKVGDIFILRTGFVKWHDNAEPQERAAGTRSCQYIGIANTMETVRWLYDQHFSAVACDTMGFEAWPYAKDCCLHEWLLCQWGTPIGELWDLEGLSAKCAEVNKWSFFLTSAPLHIKGGVGSPPGAIAVL
ncbi:hypothetical protein BJX76DRAFT_359372 [Aspergillus varians]